MRLRLTFCPVRLSTQPPAKSKTRATQLNKIRLIRPYDLPFWTCMTRRTSQAQSTTPAYFTFTSLAHATREYVVATAPTLVGCRALPAHEQPTCRIQSSSVSYEAYCAALGLDVGQVRAATTTSAMVGRLNHVTEIMRAVDE